MSDRDFLLVYIAVIVLLPMVPAIAIFKLLPSHAIVTGPFKGLKINLGGAFAAYFVVLLLLLGLYRTPPPSANVQVWEVTGKVRFSDQEEVPVGTVRFSLSPPLESVENDGTFSIKVLANMSDGGQRAELGSLRVEAFGYQHAVRILKAKPQDMKSRTVNIENPIELKPEPDERYRAGIPLQPVGASQ